MTTDWKIQGLLRESREAEGRARDLELRARRARREAVHARMQAWRLTVEDRDQDRTWSDELLATKESVR